MCGIVGYIGCRQAAPVLLAGLSRLEYRGYDSAGLAVRSGGSDVVVVKAKGRLKALSDKTDAGRMLEGTCGIGHTRWATHGEPSELNAHPHISDDCTVVGVHNGIIENYQELKEKLLKKGYAFHSQTDTEVAVKLVDYYYKKDAAAGPVEALSRAMVRIRGSYALALMFKDYPEELFAARKDSPMIIGIADGETYVASDVPAILKYTRNVYYIGNLEFAKLTPGEAHFYNLDGDEIEKQTTEIKWDAEAAEKAGFEHFMMKEIHEQPKAVQDTLNSVIKDGRLDFEAVGITEDEIKGFEQIYIVACGSAWHVGMAAQYVLEDLADISVRVELASEFRYRKMSLNPKALMIVVSQSGETADTLAALRLAKEKGITFSTPSEIISKLKSVSQLDVPYPMSWVDEERDTSSWLGNVLQREAFSKLYSVAERVHLCDDRRIKQDWDYLQASNNFRFMTTKNTGVWLNRGIYDSPYDAFTNYMNILGDFIKRVNSLYPEDIDNEELNSLLTTIKNQGEEIAELHKEVDRLQAKAEKAAKTVKAEPKAAPKKAAAKKPAAKKATAKKED